MILGRVQMTYENGKYKKLGEFTGVQLLGLPVIAPNAVYPVVYTLPLMTISMMKGTGVVTSVPSDAPDDYAALRDLQQKPKVRASFGGFCIDKGHDLLLAVTPCPVAVLTERGRVVCLPVLPLRVGPCAGVLLSEFTTTLWMLAVLTGCGTCCPLRSLICAVSSVVLPVAREVWHHGSDGAVPSGGDH